MLAGKFRNLFLFGSNSLREKQHETDSGIDFKLHLLRTSDVKKLNPDKDGNVKVMRFDVHLGNKIE